MNIKNKLKGAFKEISIYCLSFIRWLLLAVCLGAVCGVFGSAFGKSVSAVTQLRSEHGWLLFLLPIGGLLSVALYKLCRVTNIGTNQIFEASRSGKAEAFLLAPAVFAGTVITHLFGGSAGREGAALQLGGSFAGLLGKVVKANDSEKRILILSGMGSFFSALFGTPLGACVFALEVVNVGHICTAAVFPTVISSLTAYFTALMLGSEPERFEISVTPEVTMAILLKVAAIAVIGAAVSIIFCRVMHFAHKHAERLIKNEYLRIAAGAVIIILLTLAVGSSDYNGSGMEPIKRIFLGGSISYAAFALKIVFTAVTISAGFKGGEIIPTLFIGAGVGYSVAALIGLSPVLGAAVGMAALFCGATNCPLATVVLFAELFGGKNIVLIALSVAISFFLSGNVSLYSGQRMLFSKFTYEPTALSEK